MFKHTATNTLLLSSTACSSGSEAMQLAHDRDNPVGYPSPMMTKLFINSLSARLGMPSAPISGLHVEADTAGRDSEMMRLSHHHFQNPCQLLR
jgi:hypothetical protein